MGTAGADRNSNNTQKGSSTQVITQKQEINTKSSMETELVGVDNAITSTLWSLYFLQE